MDAAFALEELLRDAIWVRALARRLAAGPDDAEELVQETWLAALRRPPAHGQPLRPWLAKVARNLARTRRRGEEHRTEREVRAARAEASASTDALALRAELERTLVGLVLALEEPFRSTLLLRFYEGLEPKEIAALQGVPVATVRTRAFRGLARLRAELDARSPGGRERWLSVLAPIAPRGPAEVALAGVLSMKGSTWVAAGLAVCALAGVLAMMSWPAHGPAERAGELGPAAARDDERDAAPAVRAARAEQRGRALPASALLGEATRAEGVALSADGDRSLAGARVLIERAAGEPVALTTDREGRFEAEPMRAEGVRLRVEHAGHWPLELELDAWRELAAQTPAGEPVALRLAPLGELTVQVLASDGAPVADAYVRVDAFDAIRGVPITPRGWPRLLMPGDPTQESLRPPVVLRAATDANGELVVPGLPCGWPLVASASLTVAPIDVEVRIDPGAREARVVLRGEPCGALRGRVRWSDGRAAEGIALRLRPKPIHSELRVTQADGSYTYRGLRPGAYVLEADGRPGSATEVLVAAGAEVVRDLVLERGARVSGRLLLRNESGEPTPLASGDGLVLSAFQRGRLLEHRRVERDGSFALEAEPGPLRILVRSQAEPARSAWPPFDAVAPDASLELALEGGLGRVRIESAELDPAQAEALVLLGEAGSGRPPAEDALANRGRVLRRALRPDEAGALWIENLPPGVHALQVLAGERGAGFVPSLAIASGRVTRLDALEVGFGAVHGALPVGAPDGARVVLEGPTGALRSAAPDAKGRFELVRLPAGPYRAGLDTWAGAPDELRYHEVAVSARIEIEDLPAPACGELSCLVERGDEPVAGAELRVERAGDATRGSTSRPAATSDARGLARFPHVRAGLLVVSLLPIDGEPECWRVAELQLAEGQRAEIRFELPPERVEARFLSAGAPLADVERVHLVRADGRRATSFAEAGGLVRLDPCEAGAVLVVDRAAPAGLAPPAGLRLHHVVALERALAAGPATLELGGGELVLRPAAAAAWLDQPRVLLLELGGRPVAPRGAPLALCMEPLDTGSLRLPHLPPGALLSVRTTGPDGAVGIRALYFEGGTKELTLP